VKPAFLAFAAAVFLVRVLPHPATKGYYGLLYFIPSLVVYLYLCFELAAPRLERFFPQGRVRAAMAAVFLACFVVPHFFVLNGRWGRAEGVWTERGLLRVEPEEAAKARAVLEQIRRYTSPGDPILMLPHGCMYYYISNRRPASRHLAYTYGQLPDGADERDEIRRLARTPPRLVVIDDFSHTLHVPGPVNTFGAAYNRALNAWLRRRYREVRAIPYQGRLVHFLVPRAPVTLTPDS
jgi:hypothetical protein